MSVLQPITLFICIVFQPYMCIMHLSANIRFFSHLCNLYDFPNYSQFYYLSIFQDIPLPWAFNAIQAFLAIYEKLSHLSLYSVYTTFYSFYLTFPLRGFLNFYVFLLYVAFFGLLGHYRACQAFNSFNTYNRRNLTNFSDFYGFCQVCGLYIWVLVENFLTFGAKGDASPN